MKKMTVFEYSLYSVIILAGIALDQLTKWLAVKFLSVVDTVALFEDVLHLTYVENRGAAFGMLDDHRWVFMIVSTVAIVGIIFYMWKFCRDSKLLCLGLSLIVGGGIGNMIDRIFLGYVIDFLDFCAFPNLWMWVFNVADAFVCVGAAIVVLSLLIDIVKDSKKKSEVKTEEKESAE